MWAICHCKQLLAVDQLLSDNPSLNQLAIKILLPNNGTNSFLMNNLSGLLYLLDEMEWSLYVICKIVNTKLSFNCLSPHLNNPGSFLILFFSWAATEPIACIRPEECVWLELLIRSYIHILRSLGHYFPFIVWKRHSPE